jgi:hypothetical protein
MTDHEWRAEGSDWDDAPEIWELQTGPHLTVGNLAGILGELDPRLPVHVSVYDGAGSRAFFDPVEIGYVGGGEDRPTAVVITVAEVDSP